jgi:hypothetical protein
MPGSRTLWPLVLLLAQQPAPLAVRSADELYPPVRAAEVVRFFSLDTDEPDLAKLSAGLSELGAELVYGPRTTEARPGFSFFAVRAPAGESAKKLALALRRGGAAAHELECVAFDGREGGDSRVAVGGASFTTRDFVMGISSDIVWFDCVGAWSQFYGLPGKLEPDEIAERYRKLYAPYGGGRIGQVVRESFRWTLAATPDEKTRARLLKAVQKLEGVHEARLEGNVLGVTVELAGLLASGVAGKIPAAEGEVLDQAGRETPRVAFSTRPLHDLLAAEKLVP